MRHGALVPRLMPEELCGELYCVSRAVSIPGDRVGKRNRQAPRARNHHRRPRYRRRWTCGPLAKASQPSGPGKHRPIFPAARPPAPAGRVRREYHLLRHVFAERLAPGPLCLRGCRLEVAQIGKECHGPGCAIFQQVGKCVMPAEGLLHFDADGRRGNRRYRL